MANAQTWLDNEYPKENRKNIDKLDLSGKTLEGKLVIEGFSDLKEIKCRNNKVLTSVELKNLKNLNSFDANNCGLLTIKINYCPSIINFNVANNLLSSLDFLDSLNPKELTILSLHTNNFSERNLNPFSKFTELKRLFLDNNSEEKFKDGDYNKFSGSLEPLKKCEKLELLSIGNTNISEGLEHLPNSFRKIGLDASWEEKTAGCLKIREELKEAADFLEKVEGLIEGWRKDKETVKTTEEATEITIYKDDKKLKNKTEDDGYFSGYYRITPWKKERELQKGNVAQEIFKWWLDQNYPKNEVCERQEDKENQGKKREEIEKLSIRNLNLWGSLKMEGFIKLKELDCSSNWFTGLDLSDFRNLVKLDCSNNKLTNLDFLDHEKEVGLHYPEKLRELNISRNNFRDLEELNVFSKLHLTGLEELSVENCSFEGSLEHLKNLDRLKKINISHTNIYGGLEKLPSSCREVYCDFHYQTKNKSVNIVKELGKHLELGEDEGGARYYNLEKWREEKQGGVATIVSLERLYIIRSNIKKFVDKWGVKEDKKESDNKLKNCITWPYSKISKLWEKDKSSLSELSKLKHPDDFSIQWWLITGLQWTNRAASVVGGSLVFIGQSDTDNPHSQFYTQAGGVVAIVSPFVETITSYISEKVYEVSQVQWDEFLEDAKNLLSSYHELLGMIKPIEVGGRLGGTREALCNLRERVEEFLDEYDKVQEGGRKNGIIDIDELTNQESRKKFAENLAEGKNEESQLGKIVKAIGELENAITDYRQTLYSSMDETEVARKRAEKEIRSLPSERLDKSLWKDNLTWEEYLEKLDDPKEIRQFSRKVAERAKKIKEQKFIQEWVDISSDRAEIGLIVWLIEEKSKENSDYANPRWVKSHLKEVRKEYEEYKKVHVQSAGDEQKNDNFSTNIVSKSSQEICETRIEILPYKTPGSIK